MTASYPASKVEDREEGGKNKVINCFSYSFNSRTFAIHMSSASNKLIACEKETCETFIAGAALLLCTLAPMHTNSLPST